MVMPCHFITVKTKIQRGEIAHPSQEGSFNCYSDVILNHAASHYKMRKMGLKILINVVLAPFSSYPYLSIILFLFLS